MMPDAQRPGQPVMPDEMRDTFIVALRDGHWWIFHDNHRRGPFATEVEARQKAVSMAKRSDVNGDAGRVWVDVPGDGFPEVYPHNEMGGRP